MELVLKQATDVYKRLPWLLCGIAHHDENIARMCALQARSSFRQEPRREAHHWRAWQVFEPGSTLATDMDKLIDGAPRAELHDQWKEAIYQLKFIGVAETRIEQKHAIASNNKRGNMGPVMVSLANRAPWFERQLQQGHIKFESMLAAFDIARKKRAVVAELGLKHHELFREARQTWQVQAVLSQVLFRCDFLSAFDTKRYAFGHHEKAKEKMKAAYQKNVPDARRALNVETVKNNTILDHFAEVARSAKSCDDIFGT